MAAAGPHRLREDERPVDRARDEEIAALLRGARAASSPMISQVHRWMVQAETPLPPARSARRWSWRNVASTISAILPGGSLRHRDPIFFR